MPFELFFLHVLFSNGNRVTKRIQVCVLERENATDMFTLTEQARCGHLDEQENWQSFFHFYVSERRHDFLTPARSDYSWDSCSISFAGEMFQWLRGLSKEFDLSLLHCIQDKLRGVPWQKKRGLHVLRDFTFRCHLWIGPDGQKRQFLCENSWL